MSEFERQLLAGLLCLAYAIWVGNLVLRFRNTKASNSANAAELIIAYASQTGNAKTLAQQEAARRKKHADVPVVPLSSLSVEALVALPEIVFVVSTYGHGEPPDNGRTFAKTLASFDETSTPLRNLVYRVIALGDSKYPHFCAFGEYLHTRLAELGGRAKDSITRLDHSLAEDEKERDNPSTRPELRFKLIYQDQINRNSEHPLYKIALEPTHTAENWAVGDILEVLPENDDKEIAAWLRAHQIDAQYRFEYDARTWYAAEWLRYHQLIYYTKISGHTATLTRLPPLAMRSYTLASAPQEATTTLIVRQQRRANGVLGLASGWLTERAPVNAKLLCRIKHNPDCYLPVNDSPLLLIGAGSGLAGIRAQFMKFALNDHQGGIHIFYGERSPETDDIVEQQLDTAAFPKLNVTIDKAFSRCLHSPMYVQTLLSIKSDLVRDVVARQGQIYVCGSYQGMGESVHHLLLTLLGEQQVQTLIDTHRYCRDVY